MKPLSESLIENSKSAIMSSVELHNKPTFNYRYEICTILCINGWELILKAYINENFPDVRLILKDGTTKPFEECVKFVSSQKGTSFRTTEENLMRLYDFRNNIIHFYKENIGIILYSLIHKSILLYNSFLKENFNTDLADESNLYLLPIGFKPFTSPVDFLRNDSELSKSSNAVKTFIKSIVNSTTLLESEGVDEAILTGFSVAVVNENRIKNADIIVGITKDKNVANVLISNDLGMYNITNDGSAKKVQIEEESLFKTIYVLSYYQVRNKCQELFSDFKQNAKFNRVMKSLKDNPTFHKKRYLDFVNRTGVGQDWYTHAIFEELKKHYTLK
ncbi:MAG: DUF3644 domain-containing protein [Paludibacter sp.]